MNLNFNSAGNLHENIELTFEEFQRYFGTDPHRIEKINAAVRFFRIFSSCGCKAVYIGGSFVSNKNNPEDIDICFDVTDIDKEKLNVAFPGIIGPNCHNEIGKIHRDFKCQIFTFEKGDEHLFKSLQWDRYDFPKGMVKINFTNGFHHDN